MGGADVCAPRQLRGARCGGKHTGLDSGDLGGDWLYHRRPCSTLLGSRAGAALTGSRGWTTPLRCLEMLENQQWRPPFSSFEVALGSGGVERGSDNECPQRRSMTLTGLSPDHFSWRGRAVAVITGYRGVAGSQQLRQAPHEPRHLDSSQTPGQAHVATVPT